MPTWLSACRPRASEAIDTERATPEGDRAAYRGNLAPERPFRERAARLLADPRWSPLGHRFRGARWHEASRPVEAGYRAIAERPANVKNDLARSGSARPTRPRGFEPLTFGSVDQRSAREAGGAVVVGGSARLLLVEDRFATGHGMDRRGRCRGASPAPIRVGGARSSSAAPAGGRTRCACRLRRRTREGLPPGAGRWC